MVSLNHLLLYSNRATLDFLKYSLIESVLFQHMKYTTVQLQIQPQRPDKRLLLSATVCEFFFFLLLFLSRRLISLPYSCRITSLKSCLGQNSKWSVSSCFRDYFIFLCAPTSSCVLWHSMSHYPSQAATFCCLHSAFHRGQERTITAQLHVVIAFLTLNPTIFYTLCWPVAQILQN